MTATVHKLPDRPHFVMVDLTTGELAALRALCSELGITLEAAFRRGLMALQADEVGA